MYRWILPSIGEVFTASTSERAGMFRLSTNMLVNESTTTVANLSAKAEHEWRVSVAAIEQLLLGHLSLSDAETKCGFVFTTPAPVFSHPVIVHQLESITFATQAFNRLALMPFGVSNHTEKSNCEPLIEPLINVSMGSDRVLPLLPVDPITQERFCLVITDKFQIVMVLSEDENGEKSFQFSFAPDVVSEVWQALAGRVKLVNPDLCEQLHLLVEPYLQIEPDYHILSQFSQLLLTQLPMEEERVVNLSENVSSDTEGYREAVLIENISQSRYVESEDQGRENHNDSRSLRADVELLQAFAHEVRTPLATIRTLANLILRQKDLPANLLKRVQMIERECLEQIDRMELFFRAAELETSTTVKSASTHLTPMCLEQVLQQSIPRWQQFATRRNLTLDVVLPQKLPTVVSNPNMLDRMLTGLIENFTRSLPAGSHIQVQVIPAGDQLKLQLLPLPQAETGTTSTNPTPPIRKAIGELLMFQPETGTISLNLAATKHLFQAIGGKLIVRQRPQYGEVMTIFLPLDSVDRAQSMAG